MRSRLSSTGSPTPFAATTTKVTKITATTIVLLGALAFNPALGKNHDNIKKTWI